LRKRVESERVTDIGKSYHNCPERRGAREEEGDVGHKKIERRKESERTMNRQK